MPLGYHPGLEEIKRAKLIDVAPLPEPYEIALTEEALTEEEATQSVRNEIRGLAIPTPSWIKGASVPIFRA